MRKIEELTDHQKNLLKVNKELQRELDFNISLDHTLSHKLRIRNQEYSPGVTEKAVTLLEKVGDPMKYDAYASAPVNF